jgi:hypothetical protein
MTKSTQSAEQETPKKPSLTAYAVRNFEGAEGASKHWSRIGAAWAHRDGNGFNLVLDAVPLSGSIVLRVNET